MVRERTEDGRRRTEGGGEKKDTELRKEREMGSKINSFRDLNVYKLAFELQQEIFEISKSFPPEEKYSLTDQVRRSSRSIGANPV